MDDLNTIEGFREKFRSGDLRYVLDSAAVNDRGVPLYPQLPNERHLLVARIDFSKYTNLKELVLSSTPKKTTRSNVGNGGGFTDGEFFSDTGFEALE